MITQVPNTITQKLRLVVMSLGKITFGCRIETVYKVVRCPQNHSSELGLVGMTHLDGQAVIVVDLHHQLFQVSNSDDHGYFVIIKSKTSALIAIPVTTSPSLIDVPQEDFKILPNSYRHTKTLHFASHVAIVSNEDETLTVFVLDENALL
ncbi:MAG: chemotaxis protein CheW [Leptolyngbya sp. SIO3F4]|nr:chemotaxis protein CheW [Leptolyngbya sp. SIO3F4]